MARWLFLLLPLLLLTVPAFAEDDTGLDAEVRRLLHEPNAQVRMGRALRILGAQPELAAVEASIHEAWTFSEDAETGDVQWTFEDANGMEHQVFAYVPSTYTPEKAWPALVWLHGGVGREEGGGGASGVRRLKDRAEENGFLLVSPSTQRGAEWWTPRGATVVRHALRDLKLRWRVDADRVAVSGFSDGASGCFHLLLHDPDPYCCFLAFMGNPLTTRLSGGPTWTTAVRSRPVYAVNGGKDTVFPAGALTPFYESLKKAGCDLTFHTEEELGHDFAVLDIRFDEALYFWHTHPRDPSPRDVTWTTSRPVGEGRRAWIEITRLAADAPASDDVEAAEEMDAPDFRRPRLGFRLAEGYEGPGVLVGEVEEATPAKEAGLRDGDVIVKVGGQAIADPGQLRVLQQYLMSLQGAEGVFEVTRGDETLEIRAAPRRLEKDRPARPAELGYGVAPGTVIAQGGGNVFVVKTRGVAAFRVWLTPEQLASRAPLRVTVNGTAIGQQHLTPAVSVASLLAQAFRNGPGSPLVAGYVAVEVPGP